MVVEAVKLALEVELGTVLPAVPDGADRRHLLVKLRAGRTRTSLRNASRCGPSPAGLVGGSSVRTEAFWRSHAMYAVIIGLRGKATAIAVPNLIRSVVDARTASLFTCIFEQRRASIQIHALEWGN